MVSESNDFNAIVGNGNPQRNRLIKHGGYIAYCAVRDFFLGERKEKRRDDPLAQAAETLISTSPNSQDQQVLKATEELIKQQRMLEDTHARRRLERWTKSVISWYLIAVFMLICADALFCAINSRHVLSDEILIAILTTTTINILGLGFIVLKGHFPSKEQ